MSFAFGPLTLPLLEARRDLPNENPMGTGKLARQNMPHQHSRILGRIVATVLLDSTPWQPVYGDAGHLQSHIHGHQPGFGVCLMTLVGMNLKFGMVIWSCQVTPSPAGDHLGLWSERTSTSEFCLPPAERTSQKSGVSLCSGRDDIEGCLVICECGARGEGRRLKSDFLGDVDMDGGVCIRSAVASRSNWPPWSLPRSLQFSFPILAWAYCVSAMWNT